MTNRTSIIFLVAFMCVLPIMSSDIYFPILPEITRYFHTTALKVKTSLSVFLVGFALGQLFYGFLSDHWGRKKCLLLGLTICLFSTLGCALAPNIEFLNYARFLQGFGACSGAIMGRAIIADRFTIEESAHIYSLIGPFIGLSPAISPIIGGLISIFWPWRLVFIVLALVIFILLLLVLFRLDETLHQPADSNIPAYFRNCTLLIHHKEYWYYSSFVCGAYLAWFAFIVESSFLFSSFQLDLVYRSFLYFPLAIPYVFGSYMARQYLQKMEMNTIIIKGITFYSLGLGILIIYAVISSKLLLILIAMFLIVMANGFLIPLGTAGALGSIQQNKGAATAVLGFVQIALSALGTYLVSFFEQAESQIPLVFLLLFCVLTMWFCQVKLGQRKINKVLNTG